MEGPNYYVLNDGLNLMRAPPHVCHSTHDGEDEREKGESKEEKKEKREREKVAKQMRAHCTYRSRCGLRGVHDVAYSYLPGRDGGGHQTCREVEQSFATAVTSRHAFRRSRGIHVASRAGTANGRYSTLRTW